MNAWAPRRFWKAVSVQDGGGGWEIRLDGRPLLTPLKAPLVLPTRALADALAGEWDSVGERVDPGAMPWTRAANSAVDKVAPQREGVIALLTEYGATDLVSYRAGVPETLAARQAAAWDPLLDWAEATYGARLAVTTGVMPLQQDPEALFRLAAPLRGADAFALTALHDLVALTGSLVIGLAAAGEAEPPAALWDRSRIDETFQAEQWGQDDEADRAAAARRAEFLHAHRFLRAAASV